MRKIKFRGKRIDNNEWIYGSLVILENIDGEKIFSILKSDGAGQHVIEETIGEYTGRKDKNGKEIFESDIVRKITYDKMADISKYEDEKAFKKHKRRLIKHSKCIFDTEYEYHQNRDYKVEWYLNGFYPFADSPYNCGHCGCAENSEEMEVVGNIYDNPELLGVKKGE